MQCADSVDPSVGLLTPYPPLPLAASTIAICLLCGVLLAYRWTVGSGWGVTYLQGEGDSGRLPPGHMGLPLIGEMISFVLECPTGAFFTKRYDAYGPIFKTHILGKPNVHVSGAEHVKKVLLGEHVLVATSWPTAMRHLLGRGCLATSDAHAHKLLRKCILRAMRPEVIKTFSDVITCTVRDELRYWLRYGQVDVYHQAKLMTLRAACSVVLGADALPRSRLEELAQDLLDYGEGFFQLPIPIPGTKYYKARSAKKKIIQFVKSYSKKGRCSKGLIAVLRDSESDDTLPPSSATEEEYCNLAAELLFGAQETTACTITCAILELFKCPPALETLKCEVDRYNNELAAGNTSADKVDQLQYLGHVLKEILRIYPPIGGGYRKVLQTFQLGEFEIPKGWTVTYSIKDSHDASTIFTDKESFQPERWEHLRDYDTRKFHYLPFGAGPRACVGKEYAIAFLRLTLVEIVKTLNWSLDDTDPTFLRVPIVRPEKPLMATFSLR